MSQFFLKRILTLAVCLCIIGILFATLSPPRAAHATTTRVADCSEWVISYSKGYTWQPGAYDSATACDGGHLHLTYQTDGNFVLYCYGTPLWSTDTSISGSPWTGVSTTQFQSDGNLVVYNITSGFPMHAWASATDGKGATTLALQADSNLVIYRDSTALWASGTQGRC